MLGWETGCNPGWIVIMSALENYLTLIQKTDGKSAEITTRYPDKINCGKGCHTCCIQGLSVNGLERESIRQYLTKRPDLLQATEANVKENPHGGQRCSFLDRLGSCMIYEVRPVVCRSHGMPLKLAPAKNAQKTIIENLDVCPLNFTDMDLIDIGSHYFINLETLNTILVLLNQQFDGKNAEKRYLLTPLRIMATGD